MDVPRTIRALLVGTVIALSSPTPALTQERVGVVTTVEGTATVARLTLPEPQLLRFKDDVYVHDRITTGDRSIVRVLLGGKATVTARERSVLTITEMPNASTIGLEAGRISVAVSKGLMKPGEAVEIRTPNAVTAIRGTIVVAEVIPDDRGVRSTITLLRGLIDVTKLDPVTHQRVGPAVPLRPLQSIDVSGALPLSVPKDITAEAARRLSAEFSTVPTRPSAASHAPALTHALQQATLDAGSLGPSGRHDDRPVRVDNDADADDMGSKSNGKAQSMKDQASTSLTSVGAHVGTASAPKGAKK